MRRLFEGAAADAYVEVGVLRHTQEGDRRWMESTYHPIQEFGAVASNLQGQPDILFGPALRKVKASTKDAILAARACWVDFDSPVLAPCALPPTFVVKSSGTHNGSHLYWLLSEYVAPGQLEDLNKTLIGHIGGGNADNCWNANRMLRLPGSVNGTTGRPVKLARTSNLVYKPTDIAALAKLDTRVTAKILTGDARGYRSRSELDWSVITELVQIGMSDWAIFAVFDNMAIGDKYREAADPKHYLELTIANVREKVVVIGTTEDGIAEADGAMWLKRGKVVRQLSTFTFDPKLLLRAEHEDILLGDVRSAGCADVWENITLPRSAFTSIRALTKELPRAEWAWIGSDADVRLLLPFLVGKVQSKGSPTARAVHTVGRHDDYFVFPDHIISRSDTWTHPDGPIVYVKGPIEAPTVPNTADMTPDNARRLVELVVDTNEPEIIWPVLGWWFATPLKTVIEGCGYSFPLLNVFGSRGSGKTTLVSGILMRLFNYTNPMTHDSNTTRFVLLSLLGSSNALPVALAEFRTAGHGDYLDRYIRLSYDLGHDPRGLPDQTVVDHPLTAPFVIDGEDPLSEPAAKERVVAVRMRQQYVGEHSPHSRAFDEFSRLDTAGLAQAYIRYTLGSNIRATLADAEDECAKAFPERLPHRVRRNYTVVIAGLLTLNDWCGTELPPWRDTLIEAMSNSYDPDIGRARLHIDDLVEQAVNHVAQQGGAPFFYHYDTNANTFAFHMASTLVWYMERTRRQNIDVLGREALMAQLEEVDYITGKGSVIEGRWCYTVDMARAAVVLDVPTRLDVNSIRIDFGGT